MTWANIRLFFEPSYLFSPYPSYEMKLMPYLLIFFLILLLLSIVASVMCKKTKKLPIFAIWSRLQVWSGWSAVVGFILVFFRYEAIPYLAMRFLVFAWIVIVILWALGIVWFSRKKYRSIVASYVEKKRKEKYIKK